MRLLALLSLALLACLSLADRNRKLPGSRVQTPPKIDGIIEEAEWHGAAESSGFVNLVDDKPTKYDTIVRAAYDAENIYLAFVNLDPEPNLIRATEYRRNADLDGNDHVIILINPFKTFRFDDNNEFNVGAGGGMSAAFPEGRASKREWQGDWDARSRITDKGWECEVRIAWRALRLPSGGSRDVEINFARLIPRDQLGIAWSNVGVEPNQRAEWNGVWTGVEVPDVGIARHVQVLPYQFVGWDKEDSGVFNTGVDVRHNFSSRLTGLGTLNPDFRNIESQILDLTFSRFERLASESRPFFVEGADEYRIGGFSSRLFASQRVGMIDAGAKIFGKLSKSESIGTLFATRFDHEDFAVARYRRAWGDQSGMSAGVVHYRDEDLGVTNSAGGIDVLEQGERWGGAMLVNFTKDSEEGLGRRFDADLLYRDPFINGSVGWQQFSPNFLPRAGFAPRTGFKGWNGNFSYRRELSKGRTRSYEAQVMGQDTKLWNGEGVYWRALEVFLSATNDKSLDLDLSFSTDDFKGEKSRLASINIEYPQNDPYRNVEIQFTGGKVDGDPYRFWGLRAKVRFPFRLTISPSLQFERIGGRRDTLHVMSVSYELDADNSIGGRAVSRDGSLNWYLAFRRSGNLGAEYYVIFGDPNADRFRTRIIVKAVFPIDVRI